MSRRAKRMWAGVGGLLAFLTLPLAAQQPPNGDSNEAVEKAMKSAAAKVGPCVVRIETTGGQDTIVWVDPATKQPIRKVVGPTTGLVVDADGYVISSSFNFVNKPTGITVTVPGKGRAIAKVVATDQSRMLTLLKLNDMKGLTVPAAYPKKDMQVGQWSMALGRALDTNVDHPPSIGSGIISATNRIWGKAIQTDAKVSPVNYGGPLVAIDGRVLGVLVPASPQGEGENAGVEWYDSGIGFAVPLEDVLRVLPKLKEGTPENPKVLRGGLLGITPASADMYGTQPAIGTVAPKSAAEKAGLQKGDVILEIDGKPVHNQAQVLHALKPKYEGDPVSLKVKRGDKELSFDKVVMAGTQTAFEQGFLGILPMRDDPDPGVEVRYVYPNSAAAKAGLKPGDRIMKVGPAGAAQMASFNGRDQFTAVMNRFPSGTSVKLEVKKKGAAKPETLTAALTAMPDAVPDELPKEASKKRAREQPKNPMPMPKGGPKKEPKKEQPRKEEPKKEDKKVETGLLKKNNPVQNTNYWVYVPSNYDPNVAHGLIVWFHPAGREGRDADDMVDLWEDFCADHNFIMLGPISKNKEGWVPSEAEFVTADVKDVMDQYTIDRQRVIAHGGGIGGQMAFYMGFNARDSIRGVATIGAVLANQPKDTVAAQRLQFYIVAGEKDPIAKDIEDAKPKLTARKYAVSFRKIPGLGKQYLNEEPKALKEMMRWMDALDRQ